MKNETTDFGLERVERLYARMEEAGRQWLAEHPDARILFDSMQGDNDDSRQLLACVLDAREGCFVPRWKILEIITVLEIDHRLSRT